MTTEQQILADESIEPKKLTVTSIIITFSCIQQIQQHLWVSSVENDTDANLPVITVEMARKVNRHQEGNALLDSGAQISLICTSTAKILRLEEKDASTAIKKVRRE